MRFMKLAVAAFSLVALTAASQASLTNPVSGSEFRTLDQAQQVEAGSKVEVTEFFMYSCPHCNAFDPALGEWVKAQGDRIVFKRVPLGFHPGDDLMQKLYYAMEVLGKTEEMHKKIFHAVHVEHKMMTPDHVFNQDMIADYVASQGIDRAKFLSAFNSFGVQSKVNRAMQLAELYKIDGVPMLAVDGRYETSPSIVQGSIGDKPELELFGDTLKVADWLVAKAAKEHKPSATAKK